MSDGRVTNNQGDESKAYQTANLRSYSQCAVCHSCGRIGFTHAEQKCNVLNFLCCCFLPNCWFCCQIHKKKDLNCYDSEHFCGHCKVSLANYSAC